MAQRNITFGKDDDFSTHNKVIAILWTCSVISSTKVFVHENGDNEKESYFRNLQRLFECFEWTAFSVISLTLGVFLTLTLSAILHNNMHQTVAPSGERAS